MYTSRIAGMGKYVPENIVTNDDLAEIMDTNDAWIQERTGIQERHHIKKDDDNTTATMGVKAAKIALERAKISKDDIEILIEGNIIRVNYNKPKEEDLGEFIHKGIAKRSFNLGWKIDSKFDLSKATADFKNGLLQVIIPFAKGSEPKTLKIN